MKPLSKPRRSILEAIVMYGGSLKAEQLTVPDRRLASRMQSDGLVSWKAGAGASRHSLARQVCHITKAGVDALNAAKAADIDYHGDVDGDCSLA